MLQQYKIELCTAPAAIDTVRVSFGLPHSGATRQRDEKPPQLPFWRRAASPSCLSQQVHVQHYHLVARLVLGGCTSIYADPESHGEQVHGQHEQQFAGDLVVYPHLR